MAEKDFVVKNGLVVNTNLIVANGDSNRVGINNSAPDSTLTVTGTANVSGNVALGSNLVVADTTTASRVLVGSNVVVNTVAIVIGSSTVNTTQNSTIFQVTDSTSTSNLTSLDLKIGLSTLNSSMIAVGSNVSANSSAIRSGNSVVNSTVITTGTSTVNLAINSTTITFANSSASVTINAESYAGTSNNSTNFAGQPASHYANAENLTTGTLLNARLSSAVVNTSGNFTLSGNTTLSGTNTAITSNLNVTGNFVNIASRLIVGGNAAINNFVLVSSASGNLVTIGVSNVNIDSGVLFVDAVNNRVGISNTNPDAELTVTGSANVSGNLSVLGNLIVIGNTVSQGTQEFTGALTPSSNGILLGNSTNRWDLYARNGDFSANVTLGSNVLINSTAIVWTGNSTTSPTISVSNTGAVSIGNGTTTQTTSILTLANSAGNVQITPAGFTGNGFNVTIHAANVTTGTLPNARLSSAIVNTSGNFTLSGNTTLSGTDTNINSNLTISGTFLNFGSALVVNSIGVFHTGRINAASYTVGANLVVNTTSIAYVGNSTTSPTITLANTGSFTIGSSTTTQTASIISVANSAGSSNITPAGFFGNFNGNGAAVTSLNADNITSGTLSNARLASAVVNTSGNFTLSGNTTLSGTNTAVSSNLNVTGSFLNVASAFVANSTGAFHTGTVNAASHTVGTNLIANSLGVYHTGTVNAASHTVGTVVVANTITLTVNGAVVNSTGGFFSGLVNASAFTTTGNANAINFNSGANLTVNSTAIVWTGNSTTSPTINLANTGSLTIGNSTTTQTTSVISIANSVGTTNVSPAGFSGNGINITSINATSITNGTLPSARISGNYTGITNVGTLGFLAVTGNVNIDSGLLFVDGTNNRVGVNTTAPSVSLQIAANDAISLPVGNTAQRPTGANGMFRYNVDTGSFEGYSNGSWGTIAGSGAGGYYKGNAGAVGNTDNKANLYRINSNTQSNNVTITAGENALTAGPMVIASGFNLTIETGGRVVIV